jgi:hypothetical protein
MDLGAFVGYINAIQIKSMDIKLRSRLKNKTFIFRREQVFTDTTLVVSDHDVTLEFQCPGWLRS